MSRFSSFDSVQARLCDLTLNAPDMVRCQAVQSLGAIGGDEAIPSLIDALRDEDEDVRCDAATALGGCKDPGAEAALLTSLSDDPCGDVKLQAVVALGKLKAESALPSLRLLAVSRDPSFSWDEDEILQGGWDDWLDIQLKAMEILGQFADEEAVPFITTALGDEEGQDIRGVATRALVEMGEGGLQALGDLMGSTDRRLRLSVVLAASGSNHPETAKLLRIALADDDDQIRCRAAEILAQQDPDDPIFRELVSAKDPALRATAFRHATLDEATRLQALVDEPDALVQLAIIEGLASGPEINKESDLIFRLLSTRLHNAAGEITAAALAALAGRSGVLILPRIMEFIEDPETDEAILWAAVKALGSIDSVKSVRELRRLIAHENRMVRLEAMTGLGAKAASGDETALSILCGASLGRLSVGEAEDTDKDLFDTLLENAEEGAEEVGSDNSEVARDFEAAGLNIDTSTEDGNPSSTLGSILGDEEKAREINEAGAEDNAPVKLSSKDLELLALARRMPKKRKVSPGGEDIPVSADIRQFSTRLLGDFPTDDIRTCLETCLESDDAELRRVALDSLLRIVRKGEGLSDTVHEPLTSLLERTDVETKGLVLTLMDEAYRPAFQEVIMARLNDRDGPVRTAALRAALRHNLLSPGEAESFLRDANPMNRSLCIHALADSAEADMLELVLEFGFLETGQHKAEAGALLRRIDPDRASDRLLDRLATEDLVSWLPAISMLETIHTPHGDLKLT